MSGCRRFLAENIPVNRNPDAISHIYDSSSTVDVQCATVVVLAIYISVVTGLIPGEANFSSSQTFVTFCRCRPSQAQVFFICHNFFI